MTGSRFKDLDAADTLVGVWTSDTRTNLVVACEKVCEYFNVDPHHGLAGAPLRRFLDSVHPEDRTDLTRRLETAMANGSSFAADCRVVSTIHGTRWVHASGQCFHDADGRPTHLSGYIVDADPPADQPSSRDRQYAELIEHLVRAGRIADQIGETLLRRLIEAVMLEAGFRTAAWIRRMEEADRGSGDGGA